MEFICKTCNETAEVSTGSQFKIIYGKAHFEYFDTSEE